MEPKWNECAVCRRRATLTLTAIIPVAPGIDITNGLSAVNVCRRHRDQCIGEIAELGGDCLVARLMSEVEWHRKAVEVMALAAAELEDGAWYDSN